ncbi:MAG: phosphoserine phosphatase [Candidatus Parcubacteria bacterium]|nr:MAG: phosphoserine phosphatase [Candidatus Parcubacteria bacterium]
MRRGGLVLDFDSTIVKAETFEVIARHTLRGREDAERVVDEVERITALGMEGRIPIRESLSRRFALVAPTCADIEAARDELIEAVSPSMLAHAAWLRQRAEAVWIVSNGFLPLIAPVAQLLGLRVDHIVASNFLWKGDRCAGVEDSVLLEPGGKGKALSNLRLPPPVWVVGDGYTDYEMARAVGARFIAFTEHIRRERAVRAADYICDSFDCVVRLIEEEPASQGLQM